MENPIESARETARNSNYLLTETTAKALQLLVSLPTSDLMTPEYDKPEYLLNCDADGAPVPTTPQLLEAIPLLAQNKPAWIKIVDGQILMLRWLAHFIGFRHRAIHVFLDPPDSETATYIQIRSLQKYNQPGKFDMPVAGHVDGTDSPRATLRKELAEEIGLDDQEDLQEVEQIGTYNITIPDFQPDYQEIEHTTLFRARIRRDSLTKLRLQESEVGGLALFNRDELSEWIAKHPDRVGGGLIDSWPYYL
jgi:8-oxo-dGTP pyrophosphatase MutT (NUDIX family)